MTWDTWDALGMGDVVSNESLANLLREETEQ
jgi:acetyl-CoA synthetase